MNSSNTEEKISNLTRVTHNLIKADSLALGTARQFSAALTRDFAAGLRIYNKEIEEGVSVLMAYSTQNIRAEHAVYSSNEVASAVNDLLLDLNQGEHQCPLCTHRDSPRRQEASHPADIPSPLTLAIQRPICAPRRGKFTLYR